MDDLDKLKDLPRSERVLKIFDHPEWGEDPFIPDYQKGLLDYSSNQEKTEAAVKPGRQVGKTLTGALIAADYALTHENADVLITAPFQETADEMFRETKQYFKSSDISLDQFGVVNPNKKTWEFTNGSRILSRTLGNVSDDQPGQRGKSPQCVVVDEAHYAKDNLFTEVIEQFFITHETYEYYLFSTPRGKSGYFYEKVEQDGGWFSPHWPTKISPFAQQDFIDRKRNELDSQTFAQEYLGEFVESADAYLPHEIVKPCINPDKEKSNDTARWLGVDPAEKGDDELVIYDIDERGIYHNIWAKQTVTGTDFVGLLKDLQSGGAVPQPEVGSGQVPLNGYQEIIVESNMGGLATDIVKADLGDVIVPVKSTKKSKGPMYKRFKRDIEAQELTFPNHRKFINQTTALQYSYTENGHLKLSHPDGGHDDYPDAAMLANAGRVGLAKEFEQDMPGKKKTVTTKTTITGSGSRA